jgi:hypothetical protein
MRTIVGERLALYTFAEGGVTTAFRVSLGALVRCSNYPHQCLIRLNEVNRKLL